MNSHNPNYMREFENKYNAKITKDKYGIDYC